MTIQRGEAVQREVPSSEPNPDPTLAEARGRAISLASPPELPSEGSAPPVTESDRIAQARAAALLLVARIQRYLTGPSLWHSPPASLEDARTRHHVAGAHLKDGLWGNGFWQGVRIAWGYGVHLPAKGVGHLVDWLFSSPGITLSAFVIYIVCHYWLLHWLPWF